tara:strand:- start:641 stop:1306 length:666 start_codon:yes stop_codon:yes gene_type:complete
MSNYTHREIFFNFINELNENNVAYYFMRGFSTLPEKPDTDIDLICHLSNWDKFIEIASRHLHLMQEHIQRSGFGEYCDMIYYPYSTPGNTDNSIPNGRFRIDSYNCLHMSSPLKNFKTKWTLPFEFNDYVFDKKIKVIAHDAPYYIPSTECEVSLLVFRDVFDLEGNWKQKHINRINSLKSMCDKEEILKCISMVLPRAEGVVDCIYNNDYGKIFNLALKA